MRPRRSRWDKAGRVDRETWLKAGREGLLCLTLPTEYGGGGGDFGHAAVFNEEVNRAGLSGLGFRRALRHHRAVHRPLGNEEQKQKWLPKRLLRRDHPRHRHDRARHRQRPQGRAHHRRARRRRVRHQRQQDLHQQRPECRPDHRGLQDRPERRRQGHEPDRGRGRRATASGAAASSTRSASMRRTRPSSSSTTCACRSPTVSAKKARASPT